MLVTRAVGSRVRRRRALLVGALFLCTGFRSSRVALGAGANAQAPVNQPSPRPEAAGAVEWLIVAPHPDDAVLMAAGVIARAVRDHVGVAVALMTNGDLSCTRDGAERDAESIRALAELGLDRQHVYFLGYPDGYLARLGRAALPPVERRVDGRCSRGNHTYAMNGHEGGDVHSLWFGESAVYTAENAVTDLSALLESLRPRQIVVTHPMDVHPDHAATYALLRRALARSALTATLHRGMVHAGDCWPLGPEPAEPCPRTIIDPGAPFPPLFGALGDYRFTERIPVPDDFLNPNIDENPKLRAIREFHSQLGPSPLESYLLTFSRREEPFFVESPGSCDAGDRAFVGHGEMPLHVTLSRTAAQQSVAQDLPLAVAFDWPTQPPAIEVLADENGAYRLAYDSREHAAALTRVNRGELRVVKTWPLPQDLWGTGGPEHIELRFDARPRDGDVLEIALFVRGALVGVAVDVHPRRAGRIVRSDIGAGREAIELSITSPAGHALRASSADATVRRGGG